MPPDKIITHNFYAKIFDMISKLKLNILFGDILGGINSAIIALPQALAFGVATGFGAGAGLWGAIILCFIAGIIGTKTPMISGITGPAAIVLASIMHTLHYDVNTVIVSPFSSNADCEKFAEPIKATLLPFSSLNIPYLSCPNPPFVETVATNLILSTEIR